MDKGIYIFSDSVAFGKYDSEGGWAARLAQFLEVKYLANEIDEFFVYNLLISGNHSKDVLVRFDNEIKSRARASEFRRPSTNF